MPEEVDKTEEVVEVVKPGTEEAEDAAVAELQAQLDEMNGVKKPKKDSGEVEDEDKAQDDTKEKPAAAPTPSPVIPTALIFRAAKVMDEAEIAEYEGDPKGLEKTVAALERRAKSDSSTQAKPAAKAEDAEVEEEVPDYGEDEVAEPIAKAHKVVKGQLTRTRNEVKALKKELAELKKNVSDRYQRDDFLAEASRFDRGIASLESPDLLGEGDIEDLEAKEHVENRNKLLSAYWQIRAMEAEKGNKLSRKELMLRTLRYCFPKELEKKSNKVLADKLDKSKARMSLEPRNRKASDMATADEKAVAAMQEIIDSAN